MSKLTPRQEAFVREYLVDLNGTQAAIRAGFSARSAASTASVLLRNPKVKAAVEAAKAARAERTGITGDRVLLEVSRLAFVNLAGAYNTNGTLKKPHEMPEDVQAALQGIDYSKSGDMIGRFSGKEGPLGMLAKHLGLFTDKVKVSGDTEEPLRIEVVTLKQEGT